MAGQNPISYLQERMAVFKILPVYTTIHEKLGQCNEFTVKLDCGEKFPHVIKTGYSKKVAKQEAAKCMLQYLNGSISEIINIKNLNINCDNNAHSENGKYISKLQELLQSTCQELPTYECKNITGPDHCPKFTVVCTVNKESVEATGSTKKEAKALSAKIMYEKIEKLYVQIPKCSSKENITNQDDLIVYHNDLYKNNIKKALEIYPKFSKKAIYKTTYVSNNILDNYLILKKRIFSLVEPNEISNQLENIMENCKNVYFPLSSVCNSELEKPLNLLKNLLNKIEIQLTIKNVIKKNIYFCWIKLSTNPMLSEVGMENSAKLAEITAVIQVVNMLSIILM